MLLARCGRCIHCPHPHGPVAVAVHERVPDVSALDDAARHDAAPKVADDDDRVRAGLDYGRRVGGVRLGERLLDVNIEVDDKVD